MTKRLAILLAILLAVGAGSVYAQTQTGTIEGKVLDEQGAVLPGVTLTLSGRQGTQTTVTSGNGEYRFVGLSPGNYQVKAELTGFAPKLEQNLDLGLGRTLSVNFTMRVANLAETVEVTATSSNIDVTSTASDNTLSQNLLSSMPINIGTFNTATALLDYAPGINNGSAFGGDEDYGSALLIDGVDTRDPEAGSAWVFYNFNIIEEVQVSGVGAQAEYGGFSGAVVNTITKSGGNMFSGLFEGRYTGKDLASGNIDDKLLAANPGLGNSDVVKKLTDYTVQLGGPLKKDKAFWWASVQRYSVNNDPAGLRTVRTEVSPRYNGKLTYNFTPNDTLIGSFQYDNYNQKGRAGYPGNTLSTDQQTLDQDSPEAVWNAQYRKVFSSNTFLEAKFTGYWGYYYTDPVDESPIHIDNDTGEYRGGGGYYYYADRDRNQLNVALSSYANAYGSHSLKFGMEFERSGSHSRSEYSNCGSIGPCYYIDYSGVPTYAYSGYNYNVNGKNKRESFYAQDAWRMGRITANVGLRLDHIRGGAAGASEDVYQPKLAWNPRLGLVADLTGTGMSVVKGFWGRYYEGASLSPYATAIGGYEDQVGWEIVDGGFEEFFRTSELVYSMDPKINHFGLDEATIGFEQQLRPGMRLAVTGIWRDYKNFIASVLPDATWTPFSYTNPMTGQQMTLYRWANRPDEERGSDYLITNVDDFVYRDPSGNIIGPADAKRKYKGVMFVLSKSYSDRWQGQFSYVWSEAKGTVGNAGRSGFGGSGFQNPTQALVNNDGFMDNDRTHEFKLMGGYQIPVIELSVNGYWRSISGGTYTPIPSATVSSRTLNWTSSLRPNLMPRGSERLPTRNTLDLRIEKLFSFDVHRFAAWMDIANVFNANTVLTEQNRYPDRTISGNVVAYGGPTGVTTARQITIGGRWTF
ncbi:MAG: TonB-dependent receptor [Acidobacteriota bacterium]